MLRRSTSGSVSFRSAAAASMVALMNHDAYKDAYIRDILNTVRTIAMVGISLEG